MMRPTASSLDRSLASPRAVHRRTMAFVAGAVALVWCSFVAGPAGAQTGTTTVMAPSADPTPTAPPESSAVGGIVFFVIVVVLIAGAGLLYLRHRSTPGGRA
jgi:hypothetical protein